MSYYDINDKAFTMYSALRSKSLHLSQAIWCNITLQLAQAISYLHSRGFILWDIKWTMFDSGIISTVYMYWAVIDWFWEVHNNSCCQTHLTWRATRIPQEACSHSSRNSIWSKYICKPSAASDVYSFGRMASIFATKVGSIVFKSKGNNKYTSFNPSARVHVHLNDIIKQLGAVTKLLWIVGNCCLKFISMTLIFLENKLFTKGNISLF